VCAPAGSHSNLTKPKDVCGRRHDHVYVRKKACTVAAQQVAPQRLRLHACKSLQVHTHAFVNKGPAHSWCQTVFDGVCASTVEHVM
jgi:hypothetical protein